MPFSRQPSPWGCRSPLGFLLVLAVSAVLCCALGLAGGAVISEFGRGWLSWPDDGAVSPLARPTARWLIDRLPTRAPTPSSPSTTGGAPQPPPATVLSREQAPDGAPVAIQPPPAQVVPAPTRQAAAAAVALPANQPARPATRLAIPVLSVDVPVVLIGLEQGTWPVDQLAEAVGHLQGTASPGDPSNVAIAGHVTLAQGGDGPFRNLAQLRQGDEVVVFVESEAYRYAVTEVRIVSPEDVAVTAPTAGPQLTLITCANWNRERRAYDQRVVAIARLVS